MTDDLSFTLDRQFPVAPETLWAQFTEPALLARWFCPNPALDVRCELDLRPGGRWSCAMGPHLVSGRYLDVRPPTRLVFTWHWAHEAEDAETTVTVDLSAAGDGTRLRLEHAETEPVGPDDGHRDGWVLSLDRLTRSLVEEPSTQG